MTKTEQILARCLSLILAVGLLLGTGGCMEKDTGQQPREGQENVGGTSSVAEKSTGIASGARGKPGSQAAISSSGFPVTLTDALGQAITLSNAPHRIVSLGPSLTESLFDIGAGGRVVGDTTYDNYPLEAAKLPRVGDYMNPSAEKILSLHPDLVLAVYGNSIELVKTLRRLHVTLFSLNPKTVKDVEETLRTLGRLTGNTAEAEQAARQMENRVQWVETALAASHARPLTSLVEIGHDPLFVSGQDTVISDVLRLAGGRNVAPKAGTGYPQLSYESVLTLNPQSLFIGETDLTPSAVRARPGWGEVAAVKSGRIFLINGDLIARPAPRLVQALEQMAHDLHPEAFRH